MRSSSPAYRHEKAGGVKRVGPVCGCPSLEMAGRASHNGTHRPCRKRQHMPTLFRLVMTLAVLAGIVYGAMFALVMFVEPKQAELSVKVPLDRLDPQKQAPQ
jgi:hypothetical protein